MPCRGGLRRRICNHRASLHFFCFSLTTHRLFNVERSSQDLCLGRISFWAAGLVDQIKTNIYQAQYHYRLDKTVVLAGIEVPKDSWVSLTKEERLYAIETPKGAVVSVDVALWRGDIVSPRKTADRGVRKSATLAEDATIQGIHAGMPVEFSEFGGDMQHCT